MLKTLLVLQCFSSLNSYNLMNSYQQKKRIETIFKYIGAALEPRPTYVWTIEFYWKTFCLIFHSTLSYIQKSILNSSMERSFTSVKKLHLIWRLINLFRVQSVFSLSLHASHSVNHFNCVPCRMQGDTKAATTTNSRRWEEKIGPFFFFVGHIYSKYLSVKINHLVFELTTSRYESPRITTVLSCEEFFRFTLHSF